MSAEASTSRYWERQLKAVENRMAQSIKVATAEGAKVTTTVTGSDATAAAPAEPDAPAAAHDGPTASEPEPTASEPETEPPRAPLHFADEAGWHGFLGDPSWPPPACIVKSALVARPGHDSCDASEYLDSAAVLDAKMGVVAEMIRRSSARCTCSSGSTRTTTGSRRRRRSRRRSSTRSTAAGSTIATPS